MQRTKRKRAPGKRLSLRLVRDIQKAILKGQFKVGQRLPSEEQLGQDFSASRTAIREALQQLKARGLVRSIKGSGSYVANTDVRYLKESLTRYYWLAQEKTEFTELMDLRLLIESDCAQRLAQARDPEALKHVAKMLGRMRASQRDIDAFADADISFHMAIVGAGGNRLFQAIHSALEPMMRRFAHETYEQTALIAKNLNDHEAIYAAIAKEDPATAQREMRRHLTDSKRNCEVLLSRRLVA
ncbi:MAG: FadR family transcriptional regulator [Verrucomicrobia bacterium]|nr:FadR family transcriptional regulator [Verrucomicrobiota bacterium]